MLTRTIAVELAKDKITVNNIGPGAVYTPIDADVEAKPEIEKRSWARSPSTVGESPRRSPASPCTSRRTRRPTSRDPTYFIDGGMLRQAGGY